MVKLIVRAVLPACITILFTACNGSGGGEDAAPPPASTPTASSNWDQLNWDQDNWF